MGKLDPSQQDRWWKSRIEKEELQYGVKQQDEPETAKPPTKEVTFLNTLGQAQIRRAPSDHPHLTGAGVIVTCGRPQDPQRPLTAASGAPSAAAAGAPSPPSAAGRGPQDDEARSMASVAKSAAGKAGSVASQPRTTKGSQAGTESQSALAKRMDLLEEALAAERVKRLQAEEEMRQLMALQQQHRKGMKPI
ncbi:hypothetical protein VOLCADRAFT_105629 [Volvox carteri f. nagariensis]|uniref:Uncharacterized protein n=1 Tax=Volvox carteri f. nagariensis TaxID=3068 RepID=D8U1Z0_VOLCA|nr:uncharacterized protein VOLCADRAFT_105629 [Volvox carteri f. nagariensis]EFJ46268.1 hypothetical protein VOLCADRAFT_105629 [Volvox carteri f. nagariensis]|eukprot:XP_002952715.1 hypothetical protein VOLCADRAFT_105629 [Volvox carteri f. nagariensis]